MARKPKTENDRFRELAAQGMSPEAIGKKLGVRPSRVREGLAARPVMGRPRKRTLREGCEELLLEWRMLGDVGLSAKVAAQQLQQLLLATGSSKRVSKGPKRRGKSEG